MWTRLTKKENEQQSEDGSIKYSLKIGEIDLSINVLLTFSKKMFTFIGLYFYLIWRLKIDSNHICILCLMISKEKHGEKLSEKGKKKRNFVSISLTCDLGWRLDNAISFDLHLSDLIFVVKYKSSLYDNQFALIVMFSTSVCFWKTSLSSCF